MKQRIGLNSRMGIELTQNIGKNLDGGKSRKHCVESIDKYEEMTQRRLHDSGL